MPQDLLTKGVTQNYNTKPNKKMYHPLKKAYQMCTNFKNVTEQVGFTTLENSEQILPYD